MDATNKGEFATKEALEYWKNVDLYVGGSDTSALVEIYTTDGKLLFDQLYMLSSSNRNIQVDVSHLTEGTYYVKVQANTVNQSKLMIKQ